MKANVPQLRELVLLYGLDEKEERGTAVRRLLESMKIPAKTITEDMLCQTVGWCAEIPGFAEKEITTTGVDSVAQEEAMVLRGFSKKRLDQLLDGMNEAGIHISLKAIVTAHNMHWEFGALLTELKREREAIRIQAKK